MKSWRLAGGRGRPRIAAPPLSLTRPTPTQALSIDEVVAAGRRAREAEDRSIASAIGSAFQVHLGGNLGRERGWGVCLAARIDDGMHGIRSRLGNELALASLAQGLQVGGVWGMQGLQVGGTCALSDQGVVSYNS